MTDYSDLPQVNVLYLESQNVANAIKLIDQGGVLASFNISPPPSQGPSGIMMMSVNVTTTNPTSPSLLSEIRKALVDREAEIAQQMEELGVTARPPVNT